MTRGRTSIDFPVDFLEAFDPKYGQGVVAFIGSGPSCHAGLPSWSELLRRIAAELGLDREVEPYLKSGEYLQVAQFLSSERSERDIQDRVAKHIKRTSHGPGIIHELIVSIPFVGIVTTNYDLLLTEADKNRYFNLPVTHQNTGLRNQGREHFLLHLHGHLNEPETIVLTRQGYDQIQLKNQQVRSFLSGIFQKFVVLFIGFGFADNYIDDLLREFKDVEAMGDSSVFALIPSSSSAPLDKVRVRNLQFRFVNPIYLADQGDYGAAAIIEWLETLHNALNQIVQSCSRPVKSLRPELLLKRLYDLFVSDEWFPLFANSLLTLPDRPDLKSLVRVGLTRADIERLFNRLSLSEMRAILIFLNETRRNPVLEDALSCFPPQGDGEGA